MKVLKVKSLSEIPTDSLLDVLNPENPMERIMYRKQNKTSKRSEFVALATK